MEGTETPRRPRPVWHEALRALAIGVGILAVGTALHLDDGRPLAEAASPSGTYALLFAGTWFVAGLIFERVIPRLWRHLKASRGA